MTKYRHCDISHAPLDNKECAIFILLEKTKTLFGVPVFGVFNESEERFNISEDHIKMSYDLVKPEIYKNKELYDEWEKKDEMDEYTIEHHRDALRRHNGGNNSFKTFVVLKSIYDKVSLSNDIDFFNSCETELEENLIRIAETESLFYSMIKMLDKKNKDIFLEQNQSKKFLTNEDAVNLFELFLNEKNKTNAYNLIDFMRKQQTMNVIITEIVGQPSINHYLNQSDLSTKDIVKLYTQSIKFRTIAGTIKPIVDNNINQYHQGRGSDYYIQFYKMVIQGLEESKY